MKKKLVGLASHLHVWLAVCSFITSNKIYNIYNKVCLKTFFLIFFYDNTVFFLLKIFIKSNTIQLSNNLPPETMCMKIDFKIFLHRLKPNQLTELCCVTNRTVLCYEQSSTVFQTELCCVSNRALLCY